MSGAYTVINLSQLASPVVVEQISYETILAEMVSDLQAREPAFSALVESDPAYKILEVCAYRETILRQRTNEACKAVMLAYAKDKDLDQLGANVGVARKVITPADNTTTPPKAAVMEEDDDFRLRIQMAPEGYTTAGSTGSYAFHGLSADGDVKDVSAISPSPGVVAVYVLSQTGNGAAPAALVATVEKALNAATVRPLTDRVTVQSAEILPYEIQAELVMYDGPDSDAVLAEAYAEAQAYADSVARIGYDVAASGIYQALHRPGVRRVNLVSPVGNITVADSQASYCAAIKLTATASADA